MTVTINGSDAGFAVFGGFLIAFSTSLHLYLKGRITGMSGIFYSLISLDKGSYLWKSSFLAGMMFAICMIYEGIQFNPISGT